MTTTNPRAGVFDMGRVISRTFSALRRNGATIWPLAAILVLAPQALVSFAQSRVASAVAAGDTSGAVLTTFGLSAFSGLLGILFQAAVIYCVIEDMNGRRATLAQCLSSGLRLWLPAFAIGLLVGLGVGLGLIILLVPGLMLAMRWIVAIPVRIAEGPGINAALARSAALTQTHRWAIFGLMIAYSIVATIAFLGVLLVATLLFGANPQVVAASAPHILLLAAVIAVFQTITAVGATMIYQELRLAHDGGDPTQVGAVFA